MMFKIRLFLFFLLIFFFVTGYCQSTKTPNSTIVVCVERNISVNKLFDLEFFPPIGGKFYNSIIPKKGIIDTTNQRVILNFEQEIPCFFSIKNGNEKFDAYVEPGDTITAILRNDSEPLTFIGNRSIENNLYNSILTMEKRKEIDKNIQEKLNTSTKINTFNFGPAHSWADYESALSYYLNNQWKQVVESYANMLQEGKITAPVFDAFSTALYSDFYKRTFALLNDPKVYEIGSNYSNLFHHVFKDHIFLNPMLTGCPSGDVFLNTYARYKSKVDTTLSYSNPDFSVFNAYFHYVALTIPQQDYMLGRAFYLQKIFSNFNQGFNAKNAFAEYKKRYSDSPFIPIISKIHQDAFGEVEVFYKSHNEKYTIDNSQRAIVLNFASNQINIDTAVSISSLKHIVRDYSAGMPAYIDFWATWCIPCLREFQHAATIKQLMDDKGVRMIYISTDKLEKKDAWLTVIKQQRLQGIHILASEVLIQELREIYQVTAIPRYMIIDENGQFKNDDAPRPSDLSGVIKELNTL